MSLVPRWLTYLLVITLVGSGVPRASVRPTVLANPQPQPATAPVTLNDELPPLPDVPPVALPLVDKTSPRPTIPVTTTAHIFSRAGSSGCWPPTKRHCWPNRCWPMPACARALRPTN